MTGIVVGLDGSEGSVRALAWAVAEARLRGAPLTVVHAWIQMLGGSVFGGAAFGGEYPVTPMAYDVEVFEKAGQQMLDEAVDAIDTTGLVREVERRLVQGGAASALLDASKDADLLVVGARGVGGFLGLLLGSVTTQVMHHASCPVVVVPVPA